MMPLLKQVMASLALQLLEDLVVTFPNEQLARWFPLTRQNPQSSFAWLLFDANSLF
jgi:hypothetical protein